ncbi:helix-turn-helix domain-containing protein [Ensifer canadensis]
MLHSRVLRYIDEVARSGSIRAAGERLNVAASAINKHVLQLEEMIDEPLFERLPRGLRLTPAGEIFSSRMCAGRSRNTARSRPRSATSRRFRAAR